MFYSSRKLEGLPCAKVCFKPRLPDGIFSYQKSQFGYILERLGKEIFVYFIAIWNILPHFGIFYGHLEYFTTLWNILWPFGIFYGHLEYFIAIWNIL
jgi:hypothetical protein